MVRAIGYCIIQHIQRPHSKIRGIVPGQAGPNETTSRVLFIEVATHGTVADFLLRFQAVLGVLDMLPTEEIQKRKFVKSLKEPLRSSFELLDFSNVPLTEVVNQALNLNH